MSNVFSKAWTWSIRRSVLVSLWRFARSSVRPNREAYALLDRAALPKSIDSVIRSTIARTRLWRDEREQIAKELIAHAQDAIDAGREPKQIVETFGDPRRVAKLMRRSMKRNRPLSWQTYRFSLRAMGVMILVVLISYGAVVVRFYTSEPQIKVDYGAVIDSRNDGYSEDQKSWMVLVECGAEWSKIEHLLIQQQAERDMLQSQRDGEPQDIGAALFPYLDSEHPDYQDFQQAVRGFASRLDELRAAAQRPIIGLPVGYESVLSEKWEGRRFITGIVPAEPEDYKKQSMIGIQLIHLGSIRRLSQVLIFDARLAMEEGDTRRACANYIAVMGLARQARNESILYSELVGIAIHSMVGKELERLLREHPGVFESEQLTQLAHTHASLTQLPMISIESERMSFLDTLQRAYSDNGHGDGRMTPEAFEYYGLLTAPPDDFGPVSVAEAISIDPRMRAATMPLSIVLSNSREQEQAIHDAVMDQAQLVLDRGAQWVSVMRDAELIVEQVRAEQTPMRISFAAMLTPGMSQVVHRWYRYEHTMGAISLMLAIEAYRDEHGRLPDSLSMLQPSYVPEIPMDLMDPGNAIKYLVSGDRYVLYSVGSDGDDDGAREAVASPDPYQANLEQDFNLRFPQAMSPRTNQPIFEPGGKPKLAEPTGPDGDWILIDTRPESVPAGDA